MQPFHSPSSAPSLCCRTTTKPSRHIVTAHGHWFVAAIPRLPLVSLSHLMHCNVHIKEAATERMAFVRHAHCWWPDLTGTLMEPESCRKHVRRGSKEPQNADMMRALFRAQRVCQTNEIQDTQSCCKVAHGHAIASLSEASRRQDSPPLGRSARAAAHSKTRSESHHAFHAMRPASSTRTTSANMGVKSRPFCSSSQPVKYWPHAPVSTAKTDVPP